MPNFLTDVMVVMVLYNSLIRETTNDRKKKEANKSSKKRRGVCIFETLAYSGERSSQFARDGLLFFERFPTKIFDSLPDIKAPLCHMSDKEGRYESKVKILSVENKKINL
jgi:hypothetical protein